MSKPVQKTEEIDQELKPCFIITPIGAINSSIYENAMGLIEAVIRPVLLEFNYHPLPANKIAASGSINNQVIQHVYNDELVIANLTGINPNVMYEIAIRHSFKKQVIIMAEVGTDLPFDLKGQRTIFYSNNLHGVQQAKVDLKEAIEALNHDKAVDNPVFSALNEQATFSHITGDNAAVLKLLVERLGRVETAIATRSEKSANSKADEFSKIRMYFDRSVDTPPYSQEFAKKVFELIMSLAKGKLRSITWSEPVIFEFSPINRFIQASVKEALSETFNLIWTETKFDD